jgi:hypothetical protein
MNEPPDEQSNVQLPYIRKLVDENADIVGDAVEIRKAGGSSMASFRMVVKSPWRCSTVMKKQSAPLTKLSVPRTRRSRRHQRTLDPGPHDEPLRNEPRRNEPGKGGPRGRAVAYGQPRNAAALRMTRFFVGPEWVSTQPGEAGDVPIRRPPDHSASATQVNRGL